MSEATAARPSDRKRLQFEFSPEAYAQLARMRQEYDAQSFAELVRDALRVYDWFKRQQRAGYEIGLVRNEKLEKIVELIL